MTFVGLLVALIGVLAIVLYAREISEAIGVAQRNAPLAAEQATASGVGFGPAVLAFEQNVAREGIHTYAALPQPRRPGVPEQRSPLPRGAAAYVDGRVRPGQGMRERFNNSSRFGYAVATIFGVRVAPPQPFMDGVIAITPNPMVFQNLLLGLIGTVAFFALIAGLLAGALGRYITSQAIQPLVGVTEALQRFAARDFRAQPIAVAGRSDFDVLAHAYNAASAQVAAAFAERDVAEAQMRQFVADAGHELRTPLTIILGYIELLRRRLSAGEERTRFIFSSIDAEGQRMRTLVDNLVLLAKLEGEDRRPVEPFDPAGLVREIVDVRRGLDPNVHFETEIRVGATVIGDRGELYEALANVVDNAIKYAPGSPIRIVVDSPRDGYVEISIADEGPGIPVQDREAIFERFYRGASRGEVQGSGLGLPIARRAVERAGGTLRLDPILTRGTRLVMGLRADRVEGRVPVAGERV